MIIPNTNINANHREKKCGKIIWEKKKFNGKKKSDTVNP
jgi:hypothetical protein